MMKHIKRFEELINSRFKKYNSWVYWAQGIRNIPESVSYVVEDENIMKWNNLFLIVWHCGRGQSQSKIYEERTLTNLQNHPEQLAGL